MKKPDRALCHDEVRTLMFDDPTEENWSQRPDPYLTRILVFLFDNITILTGYLVRFVDIKYLYFSNGHKTSFILNLFQKFDEIVTHVTGAYFEGHSF